MYQQLPKQLCDPTVYRRPVIKPIHHWVTGVPGPKLDVVKLRFDARQFSDIVRSALSASDRSKNEDSMYFTVPAHVLEYYASALQPSPDVTEASWLALP